MSNVIQFKADRTVGAKPQENVGSAAILFFTGVRYVRMLDSELAADPASGTDSPVEIIEAPELIERLQA